MQRRYREKSRDSVATNQEHVVRAKLPKLAETDHHQDWLGLNFGTNFKQKSETTQQYQMHKVFIFK